MSDGCQSQFRVNLRRVGLAATLPLALQQRKWLQTGRHSRSVPQTDFSIRSYQNIELFSASGIMAQLIPVECDTETGPGGQVDLEISEAQRLFDQILCQDVRAKMLAAPTEFAEPGKDLQMRSGANRALQQAAAVETDPGRLGHGRDVARGKQPAVLDEFERYDIGRPDTRNVQHVVRREHALIGHQRQCRVRAQP